MPLPLIKIYIRALLTGLYYLHKECRTAHTGNFIFGLASRGYLNLKLENIMVSFEDPTVLVDFMDSQLESPMAFKIDSAGRPYTTACRLGLATRLEEDDDWGVWPIQPDHYRAPEMILGNGWQMPADIWNIDVLLFRHIHDSKGRYDAKLHIAKMIAFSVHPLQKSYKGINTCESTRVRNLSDEKTADYVRPRSRFLYEDLIPDRKLDATASFLEGEEREAFLNFARGMMAWHPDSRKTAGELSGQGKQAPDFCERLLAE
ncbi:hypothetical protein N7517_011488 [Penicillium concentricum]|uniref:Protein kinase domain-containing protein n=1 Tax=Penicillium concentricum TaxID=293559 RepID=A0A9W9RCQ2_9EURO|nr:uncharacterized protein N7517_011488 [Penicillium concentricum]KAJ5356879.1 hypothetical protein N7517_011488 [Penicillium concentricum]